MSMFFMYYVTYRVPIMHLKPANETLFCLENLKNFAGMKTVDM